MTNLKASTSMLAEPDQAILKKLSESAGQTPKIVDGKFNKMSGERLHAGCLRMAKENAKWIFIVKPTKKRTSEWWLRGIMDYFKPVSVVHLSDGRLAFCTWAAK